MGGMAGGFLGSMLFRGLGFGGGGGIGLFEIILLAFILYLVYRFVKKRREQAERRRVLPVVLGRRAGLSAILRACVHPRRTGNGHGDGTALYTPDGPYFDEARFGDACMDAFFKIQGAWANRDMSSVRDVLTDEMYRILQGTRKS